MKIYKISFNPYSFEILRLGYVFSTIEEFMKIFLVIIHFIITTIFTQTYASETCIEFLNPQAHSHIVETAKVISSQYQTEEMEQLLMDTAHQRKLPDIFDPKDAEALQRTLNVFGLVELLRQAISYPYNAESYRRRGKDFPADEDFALLPAGLIPTPPEESELSALPDMALSIGGRGVKETNQFFWDQINKQFMIPVRLATLLERMNSAEEYSGTLDFIKKSAGFFTPGGSLESEKIHWTFNSLIRAKLVRDLVENEKTNGKLDWSSFSSTDFDMAILLAAAYPELITLLDLFPEMRWMLSAWQIENANAGVSTASKKIKGLSEHIAEFYLKKDLQFIETTNDGEGSMVNNVIRLSELRSLNAPKILNESIEASITVSPITTDDNVIPTMSDDEERQSMWSVTSAWRIFARENGLDFEAASITTGTDPFGFDEDTETIIISINQSHPKPISVRQFALFYLELTEGAPLSFRGEAWKD